MYHLPTQTVTRCDALSRRKSLLATNMAAGIAATVYTQLDMGDPWRIGVNPSETATLVRKGVFAVVRNRSSPR